MSRRLVSLSLTRPTRFIPASVERPVIAVISLDEMQQSSGDVPRSCGEDDERPVGEGRGK